MKLETIFQEQEFVKKRDYSLSEVELLGLLLSFVFPFPEAQRVSKELLSQFSSLNAVFSQNDPLHLKKSGLNEKAISLLRVVGEIQDILLRPSLKKGLSVKCVDDVVAYCRHKIAFEPREMLLVLFLDNNQRVISEEIFFKGTVDSVVIYPRDIFKHAIDKNASSIILVHNHTSGNASPSAQDVILTQDMIKASLVLNVAILDHIIVGLKDHVSLRSMGFFSHAEWSENYLEKNLSLFAIPLLL